MRLITAPTEPVVSLDELTAHLGAENLDSAALADLALKLSAASDWVRGELGRPLITSTWEVALCRWPCGWIDLPANTQSITSITYTDSAGTPHTLDATAYKIYRAYDPLSGDSDAGPARLCHAYGRIWPSTVLDVGEPIVIRLVAGWADAASVPVPIKQAILMLAAHWYRNRDAVIVGRGEVSAELALGVQRLISPFEDRRW